MTQDCEGSARKGRPRDPGVDDSILAAVYDEIAECGFSNFSVESVANRAGVGKATIYRRWPTKEDLIAAASQKVMAADDLPDTGNLRDDLVEWYWQRYRSKGSANDGRLMGQVIVEASVNSELATLLSEILAKRNDAVRTLVERAQDQGECKGFDASFVIDVVSGALIHRSLFGDRPVQRIDLERFVDAALSSAR